MPAELNSSDLKELFTEFGKVLSTFVKKPTTNKANVVSKPLGYVLFEAENEAE